MSDAYKGIPWEQCRGIESIDLNDNLILVQAPIEQVAQSFNQVRQVARWERDVYGREIEILGYSFVVFQLRGHSWTTIHELTFLHKQVPLREKDIQLLSGLLHTKTICYLVSDTGGHIGYHLYDCGESMEKLYFTSDVEGEIDEDEDADEDEDMKIQGTCQFKSQIREIKAEDINNHYDFTYDFFREQDAYVPDFFGLIWWDKLKVGQRITLQLKGLEHDNFERMDYLVLN